jgi:acyl-CoA thioesterase FadM
MVTACVDLKSSKSFPMPARYRAAFERLREGA